MATRNLLRKHLAVAWKATIAGPYADRLINSERGLQVHFCHALMNAFGGVQRRLFIEPTIVFGGVRRHPDVVICHTRRIIGVVELKYMPRGTPNPSKDVDTLAKFACSGDDIALANDRFRGIGSVRSYAIASDAVLCWAGVYADAALILPTAEVEQCGSRFMRLDAITSRYAEADCTTIL